MVRRLLSLAVGVVGGCCWPSLATTKPFAIVEAICHSMWATAETNNTYAKPLVSRSGEPSLL